LYIIWCLHIFIYVNNMIILYLYIKKVKFCYDHFTMKIRYMVVVSDANSRVFSFGT
jgi:hypothetical protein